MPARQSTLRDVRTSRARTSVVQQRSAELGDDVERARPIAPRPVLPDSDIDVLAVVDDLDRDELYELVQRGAEIATTYALAFTPLAMSGDEFRKMERQERLLVREIARDGVPL